ncbi:MAG: hypothetical protein AAB601_00535 [Patescibacteria group bacterium]
MIVTKDGERIFVDPDEEARWWSMMLRENQADLDVEFKKKSALQASDEYFKLVLVAQVLGFEEDTARLLTKINPRYDSLHSPDPTVRHVSALLVLGSGSRGSQN